MIIIINNDSNSNNYKDKKTMLIIGNYKWKCHIIKCFFVCVLQKVGLV